jgi:hypothetical protein
MEQFPGLKSRKVEASFSGGAVTSEGGSLLLRSVDKKLGLLRNLSRALPDSRKGGKVSHELISLLRQRVYGIALGYEDLNDHDSLRHDLGFQTAVNRDSELASSATLCRLENRVDREVAVLTHQVMVETFLDSFRQAPKELILDFDATDDRVHGKQEGRFFHGYYNEYCFLPLYVFCGEQLLVSYLRPSNIDPAKHAWGILSLLVKAIRARFPRTKIVMRADSGFCRWRMFRWCERHDVHYCVGIAKNSRLLEAAKSTTEAAEEEFNKTQDKQRLFSEVRYAAESWDQSRRIIVKAEHSELGANPRFVVTNLDDSPGFVYDTIYCARGEMENRIKEQQLGLFADRTSCHKWWSNQFRLLLSSLAYILIEGIRRLTLKNTELAKAQASTIRLKLLKIGAVVTRNTRRIRFALASGYPYQDIFWRVVKRLNTA